MRIRRQAQLQRAEGEKRKSKHCFLSNYWDNWGSEKRMRGHWFSSFAQPLEHTKYDEEAPFRLYLLRSGLRKVGRMTHDRCDQAENCSKVNSLQGCVPRSLLEI